MSYQIVNTMAGFRMKENDDGCSSDDDDDEFMMLMVEVLRKSCNLIQLMGQGL